MMISRISGYTPARQAQKVNFNGISMTYDAMKDLGLNDKDISELDKRCPKNLDIIVYYSEHEAIIHKRYKGKHLKDDSTMEICRNKQKRQSNKERFMEIINRILDEYRKAKQGNSTK